MASGPENSPEQNPSRQNPSAEQELRAAISKAHIASKEVAPGSNQWVASLEGFGSAQLGSVADQTRQGLLNRMLAFDPAVTARRISEDGHSVVFEPRLQDLRGAANDREKRYLLPPWQELHPEIGEILRRGGESSGAAEKRLREMEFHAYQGSRLDVLRSPVAIMYTDRVLDHATSTPIGDPSVVVLWSKAAFIECGEILVRQFTTAFSGKEQTPTDESVSALKRGRSRSWEPKDANAGPAWPSGVPLQHFMDSCPCYLTGLIAFESAKKAVHRAASQVDSPEVLIMEIKFRDNWDLQVQCKLGDEDLELVVGCRYPEKLSFDWSDENYGLADLEKQWL